MQCSVVPCLVTPQVPLFQQTSVGTALQYDAKSRLSCELLLGDHDPRWPSLKPQNLCRLFACGCKAIQKGGQQRFLAWWTLCHSWWPLRSYSRLYAPLLQNAKAQVLRQPLTHLLYLS